MHLTVRVPALSMQADAYFIKNPQETKNAFTITNAQVAGDVLKLTDKTLIDELKELIKGHDFTLISTSELAQIGSRLSELNLIDDHVADMFVSGNMTTDKYGHQTEKDVKYNAIAMFNQMLDDNKSYARTWPIYGYQESFMVVTRALLRANQAISALSYFSHSSRDDLSISIKA